MDSQIALFVTEVVKPYILPLFAGGGFALYYFRDKLFNMEKPLKNRRADDPLKSEFLQAYKDLIDTNREVAMLLQENLSRLESLTNRFDLITEKILDHARNLHDQRPRS